ncbi:hypothetical protein ANN_02406 [Periplaneta americana]|uniref:Uncharacterized protein n=1 Tax=Periplaneta americana TaxID=6978 RepID=A0ABQ8TW62_PERAM|nr:hypothetical protein ANN_02406 [Periplaneta americana]
MLLQVVVKVSPYRKRPYSKKSCTSRPVTMANNDNHGRLLTQVLQSPKRSLRRTALKIKLVSVQRPYVGCELGTYFVEDDDGHPLTVNQDRYRYLNITPFLGDLRRLCRARNIAHHTQWFQQDRANCHTARNSLIFLWEHFGERIISRGTDFPYPYQMLGTTKNDPDQFGIVELHTLDSMQKNNPQPYQNIIEGLSSSFNLENRTSAHTQNKSESRNVNSNDPVTGTTMRKKGEVSVISSLVKMLGIDDTTMETEAVTGIRYISHEGRAPCFSDVVTRMSWFSRHHAPTAFYPRERNNTQIDMSLIEHRNRPKILLRVVATVIRPRMWYMLHGHPIVADRGRRSKWNQKLL